MPPALIEKSSRIKYAPPTLFPFTDAVERDWFYGDVYYMWENGLMLGTSPTSFSSRGTLTRGMVVTVLYRMEGMPDVSALGNPFPDVPAGQYYTNAIIWGAKNGIVIGYSDGRFGRNDDITREQMAAILHRYEQATNRTPPGSHYIIEFAGAGRIRRYARESVNAIVAQGIIYGKPGKLFDPSGNATRAEFAAVLHRFLLAI
jgi:hypothetical protein